MIASNQPRPNNGAPSTPAPSAALRGALFAFAGPHARPIPQHRPAAPSRPSTTGPSYAVHSYHRPIPHQALASSTQPSTPTGPALTSLVPPVSRPLQSTNNSAAAVAARRSARKDHAAAKPNVHPDQPTARAADHSGDSLDVTSPLPASGTVQSAKDYFQSLNAQSQIEHDGLLGTPQEGDVPVMISPQVRSRPQLSLDTRRNPDAAIIHVQGLPSEIQSPKPVRTNFAATPLEAVVSLEPREDESPDKTFHKRIEIPTTLDRVAEKPEPPPSHRSVRLTSVVPSQRPTTFYVPPNRQRQSPLRPPATTVGGIARPKSEDALQPLKRQSPAAGNTDTISAATARRIDSIANAIVAGHLASSRVPSRSGSPAKSPYPPLPRQLTDSQHVLYPGFSPSTTASPIARTPSPRKTIRHTMRAPASAVDPNVELAEKHKRSHFNMRKHPNKHREGDRKRWRDEITDIERKRYDGVWAANRGLYVEPLTEEHRLANPALSDFEQCVSNLVVKDIWFRSRLPPYVLEEVWELVDRHKVGRLTREAFIVGLWLIDQRLKGRKLPVEVSDSIWHSARGIYGLKIPKIKH